MIYCSTSHIVESLFDGSSLRVFIFYNKNPVTAPKTNAKRNEITKLANCNPACFG